MQHHTTNTVVAVVTVLLLVGVNGVPEWILPTIKTITVDATDNTACDIVVEIDGRSGHGGEIRYALESQTPSGGNFELEFRNNEYPSISCNISSIQAGTVTSFTLVATLTEDGETADLELTINIVGLNIYAPVFTGTPYTLTIDRDDIDTSAYDVGTTVYTVNTTDGDSNTVTVTIETPNTPFRLSSNDIQVDNKTAISELGNEYEFILKATDNGSPIRTSTTAVTVTINNGSGRGVSMLANLTLITALLLAVHTLV